VTNLDFIRFPWRDDPTGLVKHRLGDTCYERIDRQLDSEETAHWKFKTNTDFSHIVLVVQVHSGFFLFSLYDLWCLLNGVDDRLCFHIQTNLSVLNTNTFGSWGYQKSGCYFSANILKKKSHLRPICVIG